MAGQEGLMYGLQARPAIPLAIMLAFQLLMLMVSSPLPAVYIIHKHVCAGSDNVFFAELLSTAFFLNGLSSAMQILLGVRLPINVGMSYSYLPPIIAMMSAPQWRCEVQAQVMGSLEGDEGHQNATMPTTTGSPPLVVHYLGMTNTSANSTLHLGGNMTTGGDPAWMVRIRHINGALILAALCQFLLGVTGLAGLLMRLIGPLTVVSLVGLLALSLYDTVSTAMGQHWGVAAAVVGLVLVQSLLLEKLNIPIPVYSRTRGCHIKFYPVFKQFAVLIAIGVGWLISYALTLTGMLPTDPQALGYYARTDARQDVLDKTKWFFIPYPLMWGQPVFTLGAFCSILTAVIADMVESIGVYYASARVCDVPRPPNHAVNRGVVSESISNLLGGVVGSTSGIGSFSSSVGLITVTGVGSRLVWTITAIMLGLCGVIGKVGAALTLVPDPVIGGMTMVTLGCLFSVAFTNLQMVNMKQGRNIMILGSAIMLGLAIPSWMQKNPGAIKTGHGGVDSTLTVLLSNAMLVGGLLACLMDNLVPGTKEDRGLGLYLKEMKGVEQEAGQSEADQLYDIPFISAALRRCRPCWYVPCLPSFRHNKKERRRMAAQEEMQEIHRLASQQGMQEMKEMPEADGEVSGLQRHMVEGRETVHNHVSSMSDNAV